VTAYERWGKRGLDLAVCMVLTPILLPAVALVWLFVRLIIGSPVLFRQQRPGRHGTPFVLLKFRTMRPADGGAADPRTDAVRLHPFGRIVRALSLDELPQVWNVLRGDMSLVGPRPLLMQYLGRYSPRQARRHEVRPGLTGWAQVNGRNATTWEERFDLDVWYVDHLSLWLDLRILARTPWKVFSSDGVAQPGQATMLEFMGSEPDNQKARRG
jgi:sugar transferase EpsL